MVNYFSETLDKSLYALSDPTRRSMLARISKGNVTVSELADPFDMSLAAISKHLQVLESAKLITKIKSGRTIHCQATLQPINEVMELLEDLGKYWNQQLNSLEKYLADNLDQKEIKHGKTNKKLTNLNVKKSHQRKKR